MPADIEDKLLKEVARLERMPGVSAEATVVRTYLDTVLALPWTKQPVIGSISSKPNAARRGPLRPGDSQGTHSRLPRGAQVDDESGATTGAPRFSASSGRRASARRASAARSPRAMGRDSCASASAACGTKPKSAATGAPTSARCRAGSSTP